MAAAKTRYQQSVSERNKLMMGKIQNESSDMRLRMQSMLMPSDTSEGATFAPASAKAAEQQQPPAQGSPCKTKEKRQQKTKDKRQKATKDNKNNNIAFCFASHLDL
jgi:hypothetical protein